jgi:chromosome segregation ATPase
MPTPKRSARKDSKMSRLDRAMAALAEAHARTAAQRARLNDAMDDLGKAQAESEAQSARTDAAMAKLASTMKRLAEAQREWTAELTSLSPETRALGSRFQTYLNKLPRN